MTKLFAILFCLQALCFGQQTTNQNVFDVRLAYNASPNGYTTTTGTGTASATTITLASVSTFAPGMGIFVAGACTSGCTTQASGTNYVSYIASISGSVVTLHDALGSSVSGAAIKHDETRALNAALAAAFNGGGGRPLLSRDPVTGNCVYKVSGARNSTTNSNLTLPQNLTGNGNPIRIEFVGEVRGYSADFVTINGGCGLDFTDAPAGSGTQPSAIAVAPYVVLTAGNSSTSLEAVDLFIDNMFILLPNQTTINGVMLNNAERANIGDNVVIGSKVDSNGTYSGLWSAPTGGTTCLWMPGWLNNVVISVGQAQLIGCNVGLVPSEHTRLGAPYFGFCNIAMSFWTAHDEVFGSVRIEQVPLMWSVDGSVTIRIPINIVADNETTVTGSSWWKRGTYDLVDTGNKLYGELHYKIKDDTEAFLSINKNGGSNLVYCNNGAAPTLGVCTP